MYQNKEIDLKMQNPGSFTGPPKKWRKKLIHTRTARSQALTYITFSVPTFLVEYPVPGALFCPFRDAAPGLINFAQGLTVSGRAMS